MTNQTKRVLELLKYFNNGKKVCINSLKYNPLWESKSEKTIRRDLDVIKEVFPDSFELIRGDKGCYKAITKKAFNQFLDKRNLSLLIQTFNIAQRSNLFSSLDINSSDKRIIESKLKESKKLYLFKTKPFESSKDDYNIMSKIESAIYHQKYINIEYLEREEIKSYKIKPYKIIFINEIFYLACEVDNIYRFSIYRVSKIENIEDTNKNFYKDRDIEDFINFIQTPFAKYQENFREHLIEVIIEVDKSKAYYFQSKKFLNSQKLIEIKDNGNLILSYIVTQNIEIEELIKRWIPYLKVISPKTLKDKIESDLKIYLNNTI